MFGGERATQKQAPREFYTEVGHRSFHTVWTRSRQTPDKMLRALDRSRPQIGVVSTRRRIREALGWKVAP
jgi:hypothetical protein